MRGGEGCIRTKKIKRSRRRRPVPCRYFDRDPLSVLLAGEAAACVLYNCATKDSPGGRLAERESPGATKEEPAAVRGRVPLFLHAGDD